MSAFSPTIINALLRPRLQSTPQQMKPKEPSDRNTRLFINKAPTRNYLGENTTRILNVNKEQDPCGFLELFKLVVIQETRNIVSPFLRCTVTPEATATLHYHGRKVHSFPVTSAEITTRYNSNGKSAGLAELGFSSLSLASNGDKYSVLVNSKYAALAKSIGTEESEAGPKDQWRTIETNQIRE